MNPQSSKACLICWDAPMRGKDVLITSINSLESQNIKIDTIWFLYAKYTLNDDFPLDLDGRSVKQRLNDLKKVYGDRIKLKKIDNLTNSDDYREIQSIVNDEVVIPLEKEHFKEIHIAINSGTRTMTAVWVALFSGGYFQKNTRIWIYPSEMKKNNSNVKIKELKIDTLQPFFSIQEKSRNKGYIETGHFTPRSKANKDFREDLISSSAISWPLLILGERGAGKSAYVNTIVSESKKKNGLITNEWDDKLVIEISCAELEGDLASSRLFGYVKGAYTGAKKDTPGLLKEADKKILFLDEIQDLPKNTQRKLMIALQKKSFLPVGSSKPENSDFQLVCASNSSLKELNEIMDPDFFDRIASLRVTVPPLRNCREDIKDYWKNVWNEMLKQGLNIADRPYWSEKLEKSLNRNNLTGNFRDLQLLVLCFARDGYRGSSNKFLDDQIVSNIITKWEQDCQERDNSIKINEFQDIQLTGNYEDQVNSFKKELAVKTYKKCGTWKEAAKFLNCNEKTLRENAKS